jgi:hypothetical protein
MNRSDRTGFHVLTVRSDGPARGVSQLVAAFCSLSSSSALATAYSPQPTACLQELSGLLTQSACFARGLLAEGLPAAQRLAGSVAKNIDAPRRTAPVNRCLMTAQRRALLMNNSCFSCVNVAPERSMNFCHLISSACSHCEQPSSATVISRS